MTENPEDLPIPGPQPATRHREVADAAWALAAAVHAKLGCRHGRTAFYHKLLSVIDHAVEEPTDTPPGAPPHPG